MTNNKSSFESYNGWFPMRLENRFNQMFFSVLRMNVIGIEWIVAELLSFWPMTNVFNLEDRFVSFHPLDVIEKKHLPKYL